MHSHALRTLLNISTKLTSNPTILKNTRSSLPVLSPVVPKCLLGYPTTTVKHFSNNDLKSNILKDQIEQRAQAKLKAMIAENPELEVVMKSVELEIEVMRQNGEKIPSVIKPRHWPELLKLSSSLKRAKFLNFLFINEKRLENRKQKQLEYHEELERVREERKNTIRHPNELVYSIGNNCMFRRIVDGTMNQLWNWNCLKSIMYGNKIVFDCSYESLMNGQEIKSCAKQIMVSFSMNRTHNYPYHIYLCNLNMTGNLVELLRRYIPTIFDNDFPMTVTTKSYLELFQRESIVYLTSNAPKILETYNPESIYIIGAFVDKGCKQRVSLGKAKAENLQMAKLPIDKYVQFGDGSGKDLTLNQVLGIMLDAQTGDWENAMTHVPRRKTYQSRCHSLERKLKREISNRKQFLSENYVEESKPLYKSAEVSDYSYAARVKLREQWNKE